MARKTPAPPAVGEVLAMPLPRGWSACQVLEHAPKGVVVVGLDHWSAQRPELADVALRPLYVDHHFWARSLYRLQVSGPPPASFVALGAAPLAISDQPPCTSYGGWTSFPLQSTLQVRWNALPADARDAFHRVRQRHERVAVRLPDVEATVWEGVTDLALVLTKRQEPYDFTALDALPALLKLDVTGAAPGLLAWLATRPLIETLTWRGELPDEIDLRATTLRSCALDADGARTAWLPTDLEALTLSLSEATRWRVHARDDGAPLALSLRAWRGEWIDRVDGLDRVEDLTVTGFESLDLRRVAERPLVRSLTLHGAPGDVQHADALGALSALETLSLHGCLRLDTDHMPALSAWPKLRCAEVVAALADEGAAVRARWGRDRRVSVRSLCSADWPRHHAGHPFLRWRDARRGGLAGAAYASTSKKLDAAGGAATAVRTAMQGFVKGLQRLHDGEAFTPDEARDIEAAWSQLLARVSPTLDAAATDAWLAAWRAGW